MATMTLPDVAPETESYFSGLRIRFAPAVPMTQDQYFELCQQNPDKRFERTAEGELIIMVPSAFESSVQNVPVIVQLHNWAKGKGKVTESSGGYTLPNGANRAPDAAWITPEQLAGITPQQAKKFAPVCPYFLVEIMSPSDRLTQMQTKMEEYMANGTKLGLLIDPSKTQVHVYRPGQPVQILDNPKTLAGDPEMPGFVLDMAQVWQP